jgi:hypothetical protein
MQLPNKRTGVVTALVCAALAITACGGGSDDSSDKAASGPATGTITIWARDTQKQFMGSLADAYNKSHQAKAKVSIIPSAQFVQKFGTAAGSGSAPDVASIDLVYLPYFASQGAWPTSPRWPTACPTRTPSARRIASSPSTKARPTRCPSPPRPRSCTTTRRSSRRRASTPTSRPPTTPR